MPLRRSALAVLSLFTVLAAPDRAHARPDTGSRLGKAEPPLDASRSRPEVHRDRTPLQTFLDNVARGGTYEPGELMVHLTSPAARDVLARAAQSQGCTLGRQFGHRPIFYVHCPDAKPMPNLIAFFEQVDGVRWLEAGFVETLEAMPNDLDVQQWYQHNTGQVIDGRAGVPGADMRSLDAWDITTGDRAIPILIVDGGVYPAHEDLAAQIWVNQDEDCTNGVDDDHNGYIDDCHGYDFADDDNDPDPTTLPEMTDTGECIGRWHATMIGGLAGAQGNNGKGMSGINWNLSFMNTKKQKDATCVATTNRSVEAIAYGIDNGAKVISMSFTSSSYSAEFEMVLQEAEARGLLLVSSGGNGGLDDDGETRYPNQFNLQHQIVAVFTNNLDQLDPGSNWGAHTVDIAAPAAAVLSTYVSAPDAYSVGTGASFAAGMIAGAAALTWSAYPELTNAEVQTAILEGAVKLPSLDCATSAHCIKAGGGRLDLWGTLLRASQLEPAVLASSVRELSDREGGDGDGKIEAGERVQMVLAVTNSGRSTAFGVKSRLDPLEVYPDVNFTTLSIELGKLAPGATSDPGTIAQPIAFEVSASCAKSFLMTLQLIHADRFGTEWTEQFNIPVACGADAIDPPPNPNPDPNMMQPGPGTSTGEGSQSSGCTDLYAGGSTRGTAIALALLGLLSTLRSTFARRLRRRR